MPANLTGKRNHEGRHSKKTVYRLSVYLRCLERFAEDGVQTASSHALAQAAGVKPTQLRKDLTSFGHFGTRGLGYDVLTLHDKIAEVLGRTQLQPVVLVGVGHLGLALLAYKGFEKESFEIVAGFDVDVKRKRRKTTISRSCRSTSLKVLCARARSTWASSPCRCRPRRTWRTVSWLRV